jgi:5-methylcytosine-specific restriction protein B
MSYSDDVRHYCIENYIKPARENRENKITLRAGDIHKELNYSNRMPLVCSALGSIKFETEANIEKISITGPLNGANALFHYRILFG